MITWLLAVLMTLSPALLLAHPGDHSAVAPAHFLSSPWHLPGLLVIAAALVALALRGLRDRRAAPHATPKTDRRHDPR